MDLRTLPSNAYWPVDTHRLHCPPSRVGRYLSVFERLLVFQDDYAEALMQMGERDAERRHPEIEVFLRGCPGGPGGSPEA
jgi:hypothetical protein